jgi:hypothetical protein
VHSLKRFADWGQGGPTCEDGCATVHVAYLQASSGRADAALDADVSTSFCGKPGDHLLVAFERPYDIASMVLYARGVSSVKLVSGAWDEAVVELGSHPGLEASPPWVDLGFEAAEAIRIEVTGVQGPDPGCIQEVVFTGVPTEG